VSPISNCFATIADKGSPYTSRASFSGTNPGVKRVVESMEIARDRVAAMAFPCNAK